MARIETSTALIAAPESDDPLVPDRLRRLSETIGYAPTAILTMAKKPRLTEAVLDLAEITINGTQGIDDPLRRLVNCEAARAAGVFYSSVHLVHAAHDRSGIAWSKLAALPDHRDSPLFSAREKAALALAAAGATLPMGPVDAAMAQARTQFDESELVEIVATIAALALVLHWNGMVAPALEAVPAMALDHVPWLRTLARDA